MAIENGIIVGTEISIDDVVKALGESTYDLGSLCVSEKINPWAKYKPNLVANNPVDTPSDYWKGIDGNCGWEFPIITAIPSLYTLKNSLMIHFANVDGSNGWGYKKASGMYRLLDFAGYQHAAEKPFDKMADIEIEKGTTEIFVTPTIRTSLSAYKVTLNDIASIKIADPSDPEAQYRFGALLYGAVDGVEYFRRSISDQPLIPDGDLEGSGVNASVTLDVSTLPVGEYTIYPIFGSQAMTDKTTDAQIRIVPCPFLCPANLSVVASAPSATSFAISANAVAETQIDGATVTFTFTLINNSSVAVSLEGNYVRLWPDGRSTNAAYADYSIRDTSVAAGKQETITLTVSVGLITVSSEWEYSFNDGEYSEGPMGVDFKVQDSFDPVLPNSLIE